MSNQQLNHAERADARSVQTTVAQGQNSASAGTTAIVSLAGSGKAREASYGSAKSADASHSREEHKQNSKGTGGDPGGKGRKLDMVA